MTRRVLVVGIDGVRYDVVRAEPTPALDRVAAAGFLLPSRVDDAGPTISGPSWSTIMTGTLASSHRVLDNDFRGHALADHPDLVATTRRQRPEVATFVAAAWPPLVTDDSGGPLFAGGGWFPPGPAAHTPEEWELADDAVTAATLDFLAGLDGNDRSGTDALLVTYLGAVDETGHALGVGEPYRAAVRAADVRLGRLLDAIAGRPGEDWTVVVVTDHGHVDAGGHGGDSVEERTAWVAACGPGVPAGWPGPVAQADVAAHALAVLGVEPVSDAVVGRRFGG